MPFKILLGTWAEGPSLKSNSTSLVMCISRLTKFCTLLKPRLSANARAWTECLDSLKDHEDCSLSTEIGSHLGPFQTEDLHYLSQTFEFSQITVHSNSQHIAQWDCSSVHCRPKMLFDLPFVRYLTSGAEGEKWDCHSEAISRCAADHYWKFNLNANYSLWPQSKNKSCCHTR